MAAQPHQLEPVPESFRPLVPDHGKSPWHPSVKATARVPNPHPAPQACDCCRSDRVEIRHHTQIYGREFNDWPWAYFCLDCGALVGMHPFTSIPLGTMADKALRTERKNCKQPFEVLWKHGRMSRDEAYVGLASALGLTKEQCHFGLFNTHQCRAARDWAVAQLRQAA